jgi:hypothetical protein
MSIKLHVSVCRKVGTANYGSNGGTCGLEVEIAGSLLADPAKLAATIRGHFDLCEIAVNEELAKLGRSATNGTAQVRQPLITTAAPPTANGQAPTRPAARPPEPPAEAFDELHSQEFDASGAEDDDEADPPTTGGQLLGWARKQPHDAKNFAIKLGKKHKFPPRILDWTEAQVTTVYRAYRQAAASAR